MEEYKIVNGRKCIEVNCSNCGKIVTRRATHLYKTAFCSNECMKKYRTEGKTYKCGFCSKDVYRTKSQANKSKTGKVFCNRSCATSHHNQIKRGSNHPNWKGNGYRKIGLEYYGCQCSNKDCELTKAKVKIEEKMLDVHHIDKDRTNNKVENLKVLCVWCHAKQTRKDW